MPLQEHLRELRSRFVKAAFAVALGAIGGWFLYPELIAALKAPLDHLADEHHTLANLNFGQVASPFNLKIKISVYLGMVIASPVWLYQLWAFIVPGLTKREKRYALVFVAAAVPLFLSGLGLAWLVLPNAINFFAEFTPAGSANLISADEYLTFVTQIFLAFGVAFVVPLLLIALDLVGVLTAATLAHNWRIAVFLTFLFAAIASPSPDAGSMLALAFPMTGLYAIAVGICWLNDRRRHRRDLETGFAGLDDDEASPLDLDAP
ncbi:MAG: sec-independent protein translocase protein TatC [Actinomycetota bacterium]|nr:sec-independent protein translocase protein TatC [Actinomycetota bacterium]